MLVGVVECHCLRDVVLVKRHVYMENYRYKCLCVYVFSEEGVVWLVKVATRKSSQEEEESMNYSISIIV